MSAINWFLGAIGWLQTNGRGDFVTLTAAVATFIYVGVALVSSVRSDFQARSERAKADLRVASLKRTTKSKTSPEA